MCVCVLPAALPWYRSTQYVFDAVSIDDKAIWGMYRYTWSFVPVAPPPPPAASAGMSVDVSALPSGKRPNDSIVTPARNKIMKPSNIHIDINGDTGSTTRDECVHAACRVGGWSFAVAADAAW